MFPSRAAPGIRRGDGRSDGVRRFWLCRLGRRRRVLRRRRRGGAWSIGLSLKRLVVRKRSLE